MAREIFSGHYTFAADIFALGCILKELMTLKRIENYDDCDISKKRYSPEIIQLCVSMLKENPKERPTIQQIITKIEELQNPKVQKTNSRKSILDTIINHPIVSLSIDVIQMIYQLIYFTLSGQWITSLSNSIFPLSIGLSVVFLLCYLVYSTLSKWLG